MDLLRRYVVGERPSLNTDRGEEFIDWWKPGDLVRIDHADNRGNFLVRGENGDLAWIARHCLTEEDASAPDVDMVNHPPHYQFANGVEVIDLTEQLTFNAGNAVKYLARAGRKTEDPIPDLLKAQFYVNREINRLQQKEN